MLFEEGFVFGHVHRVDYGVDGGYLCLLRYRLVGNVVQLGGDCCNTEGDEQRGCHVEDETLTVLDALVAAVLPWGEYVHEFLHHVEEKVLMVGIHFSAASVPDEAIHEQGGQHGHGDNQGGVGVPEEHGAEQHGDGDLEAVQKGYAVPVEVGEGSCLLLGGGVLRFPAGAPFQGNQGDAQEPQCRNDQQGHHVEDFHGKAVAGVVDVTDNLWLLE